MRGPERQHSTRYAPLANDNDSGYAGAKHVAGDVVLLEEQTVYESSDSDDVVMRATISRFHDDEATPTGALDSNADDDELLYTAANLAGRIHITAMWYDDLGRLTDSVEYGNNDTDDDGDTDNFDRDGLSVPSRSDKKLVSTFAYYDDGEQKSVTDARGLEARTEYDDAGRVTKVIRNYVNGTPGDGAGDDDQTVKYEYEDGLRTKIIADMPSGSTDQETIYTHGTTKGTDPGQSKIGTGHLPYTVQYPDSSGGTDVVTFAYNAQSQEIWRKDQVGYILEKDYDDSGRLLHDCATNTGSASGFDEAVLRITFAYDGLGRRQTVTQYDDATVASGSVLDQVKYTYGGWGRITKIEQDNNSAVSGGGDHYTITYAYAKATSGRNTIRLKEIVLPSGAGYALKYSSDSGKIDDDASRVTSILEGLPPAAQTVLVTYEYLGVAQLVGTTYDGEDIKRERFGATSGIYDAFDNFERVVKDKWVKDLATDVSIYEVDLTYDRNSNITSLDEISPHVGFDVKYTIDGLDRLTNAQEGTLSGGSISSETREQTWTDLDHVGNWEHVKLDLDGDGNYNGADEYDDDRTHNEANELTARDTDDDSSDDYTLTYDAAGNLTDDGESYKYEYDVWYRLRRVRNQSDDLVAEYRYNGLRHRIAEHADREPDGDVDANDEWHHFVNDERWRVVAMFVDTDTDPTEEFLHHAAGNSGWGDASYIDELALRDRDTDANGSLEERLWYIQNWRHDVVALIDGSGDQREMVRYSAYGGPFVSPGGDADSDGDNDDGDTVDSDQIQSWIDAPSYDVRGDIDLDGDVDSTDQSLATSSPLTGLVLARGALSAFDSVRGAASFIASPGTLGLLRNRVLPFDGRWSTRDPLGYVDGPNLYEYARSAPVSLVDPMGTSANDCVPCVSVQSTTTTCGTINNQPAQWRLYVYMPTMVSTPGRQSGSLCSFSGDLRLILLAQDPADQAWRIIRDLKAATMPEKDALCVAWHNHPDCKKGPKPWWPRWRTFPKLASDTNQDNGHSDTRFHAFALDAGCGQGSTQTVTIRGFNWQTNPGTCRVKATIRLSCRQPGAGLAPSCRQHWWCSGRFIPGKFKIAEECGMVDL